MLPSRKSNKRKSPTATSASSSSLSSASSAAAANAADAAATAAKKPVTYGSNSRRLLQHLNIFAHSAADADDDKNNSRASTPGSEELPAAATSATAPAAQSRRRTTAQLLLPPRAHKQQRPPRSPSPLVQTTSRQVQQSTGAGVNSSEESTAHSPPTLSQSDKVVAGDQHGKDSIGAYTTTADGNEHGAPLRGSSTIDTVMTTADPSPEDVETVSAFTGVAPALARRYLKVKGNNVENAVNAILEAEDIDQLERGPTSQFDHSWDEGHFAGPGRDGEGVNLQPLGASGAPTRGPSPAGSLRLQQPKSRNDEDDELEKALRASREEAGLPQLPHAPPQQESGVLMHDGTEVKQFGPATKDYYDSKNWAMVPAKTNVGDDAEAVADLEPAERVHLAGEPRLLKHFPDGDYTPNLITICHAIPAAREALLMRDRVRPDYGKEEDWWRGRAIPLPRVVNIQDGSSVEPELDDDDELVAEIQRLMAFLDASDRSYASLGALTQTSAIKNADLNSMALTQSGTLMEFLLMKWSAAEQKKLTTADDHHNKATQLFTTTVGTKSADTSSRMPKLTVVDMPVTPPPEGEKTTLLEQLDALIWRTSSDNAEASENYIEHAADVLVMRLHSTAAPVAREQLGVDVPAAFHIDKYLAENAAATRELRQAMAAAKHRIGQLAALEHKLRGGNPAADAKTLLQHSLAHFSGQTRRDADKNDTTNAPALVSDTQPLPAHYADVAAKLEAVMASIDAKLGVLAAEKEKTRQTLAEMSRASAAAAPAGGVENASRRYTLRGVATKPNITYVLQKKEATVVGGVPRAAAAAGGRAPPLERMDTSSSSQPLIQIEETPLEDLDDEDTTPRGYQWWRIDYEVSSATALQTPPKITITKAPDYDVLRAAELEHNSALLVYASDAAVDFAPGKSGGASSSELPDALREFVQRDNALFRAELEAEAGNNARYHYNNSSTSRNPYHNPDSDHIDNLPPPPAYMDHDDVAPSIEGTIDQLGWKGGDSATVTANRHDSRRDSLDSTKAHFDVDGYEQHHANDDEDMLMRDLDGTVQHLEGIGRSRDAAATAAPSYEQHHAFGLGYDIGGRQPHHRREAPGDFVETEVAEIKLSPSPPPPSHDVVAEDGEDVDMADGKAG